MNFRVIVETVNPGFPKKKNLIVVTACHKSMASSRLSTAPCQKAKARAAHSGQQ